MTMAEHNEAERTTRAIEQATYRVCEALIGTCVMARQRPDHAPCNEENCAAIRAAFAYSANTQEGQSK